MNPNGPPGFRWIEELAAGEEAEAFLTQMLTAQTIVFEAVQRMTQEAVFDLWFSEQDRSSSSRYQTLGFPLPAALEFPESASTIVATLRRFYRRMEVELAAIDQSWDRADLEQSANAPAQRKQRKGPYRRLANIKR